jgi:hypothetical protein
MSAERKGLLQEWINRKAEVGSSRAAFYGYHFQAEFGDEPIKEPRKISETAIALRKATKEYKKNPDSLDNINNIWTAIYARYIGKAGLNIKLERIPPYSSDFLKRAREGGKALIYCPIELSGQEDRYHLGEMFPEMRRGGVMEGNYITNILKRFGWRWFDISLNAPNLRTFEWDLKKNLVINHAAKPTLNEYIIASKFSRITTGHYLDENNPSRILGSNFDGIPLLVSFEGRGGLWVRHLEADERSEKIGARFSWFAGPESTLVLR